MKQAIWTPQGVKGEGVNLHRVEMTGMQMGALREFADFARHFSLGLHCSKCGTDLVGKNASYDGAHIVACACREFIGPNNARVVG